MKPLTLTFLLLIFPLILVGNFEEDFVLDCSSAIPIGCGQSIEQVSSASIANNQEAYCGGSADHRGNEFIYAINVSTSGTYQFLLRVSNPSADLDMFLIEGCDASICIDDGDIGDNSFELINAILEYGKTYYLVIDAEDNGGTSGISSGHVLNFNCTTDCSDAEVIDEGVGLGSSNFSEIPSNTSFYLCDGVPSYRMSGPDKVFSFTPLFSDLYNISLDYDNSSLDLDLFVLGQCNYSTCIANSDGMDSSIADDISANLEAGVEYLIVVDGDATEFAEVSGDFTILVEREVCDHPDFAGLMELYESTGGENWTNKVGWVDGAAGNDCDPCNGWYGVRCNSEGRVDFIDLDGDANFTLEPSSGNNLKGLLPDLNLEELRFLFFADNALTGEIPNFSNMPNLVELILHFNLFEGSIPDFSNTPHLTTLYLSSNNLSGSIPNFSSIPELRTLSLSSNQLTGGIPNFDNLEKLSQFVCMNNLISGEVPTFQNSANLWGVYLSNNQLDGSIPDLIHENLNYLRLDLNSFTGEIPNFQNSPNLVALHLYGNNLTGEIPDFQDFSRLEDLRLNDNNFTGEVPDLQNSPNLERLYLHNNDLSGCYSDFICTVEDFRSFANPLLPWSGDYARFCNGEEQIGALCNNGEGIIDENCDCVLECGSHPDYADLMELYNDTDGPNWTDHTGWVDGAAGTNCDPCNGWFGVTCENERVTEIKIVNRNLAGEIPDFQNLANLQILDFSSNSLTGSIPDFQNLDNLISLRLEANDMTGTIPDFQFLSNLVELYLNNNNLSGEIPDFHNLSNLNALVLAHNELSGEIPDFQNLPNLTELWLDHNELDGEIPDFQNWPNLDALALGSNNLNGEIPDLTKLTNLSLLLLEENNLSGCYPEFICQLDYVLSENNMQLPWSGDYEKFCNGEEQVGAPCNNGEGIIDEDCNCVNSCEVAFSLEEDVLFVEPLEDFEVDVLLNDVIPDNVTWKLIAGEQDLLSDLEFDDFGIISGSVDNYFSDTITVTYEVCLLDCDKCHISSLKLLPVALEDIVLTNVITPNGDETNDELRFSLDKVLRKSKLSIFNRWGDRIYQTEDYENNWTAEGYPGGVYFYVLEYRNSVFKKTVTVLK